MVGTAFTVRVSTRDNIVSIKVVSIVLLSDENQNPIESNTPNWRFETAELNGRRGNRQEAWVLFIKAESGEWLCVET